MNKIEDLLAEALEAPSATETCSKLGQHVRIPSRWRPCKYGLRPRLTVVTPVTTRVPEATDLIVGTILEVALPTSQAQRMMVLARRGGSVYMTNAAPASPPEVRIICRSQRRVDLRFRIGEWRIAEFRRLSKREEPEIQALLHTQFPTVFRAQDS